MATASKTGAQLIVNSEDYASSVLDPNLSKPILVFFTAPWCGPCRLSIPVVKEVMKQYSQQIDAVEVCTDDCPQVASDSNVVSIPTIQIYNKGELMDTVVGCVAKSVLASVVEKVLEDADVASSTSSSAPQPQPDSNTNNLEP